MPKGVYTRKKRFCKIDSCDAPHRANGYCNKHYQRLVNHGDPHHLLKRENGEGCITNNGYLLVTVNGKRNLMHIVIAEETLGRFMNKAERIHHVDGNGLNNDRLNLVICPNQSYHLLLHKRQRALEACGNANWIKCSYCGKHDTPENLYKHGSANSHKECARQYGIKYRQTQRNKQC